MSLIQIRTPDSGKVDLPLLRLGFRPFFLLAGISAVALMLYWLALLNAGGSATVYTANGWHAHEMLFGFAVAVIAGFLLTAAKNWTNLQTLHGFWLGMLALVWLAGRVAPWLPMPTWVIAVIDLCFLPLLAIAVLLPVVKASQYQQLIFIFILLVLFGANLLFHLGHLYPAWHSTELGIRLAWMTIIFLITVMGGRVIPFFIERGTGSPNKIRTSRIIEVAAVVSLLAWMLAALVPLGHAYVPYLACLAGMFQLLRWSGWYLGGLWRIPLLWILYLGYGWIPLGLFLYAYSGFAGIAVSPALHAFTAGTIGMLTIGMMSRVALGHTGRNMHVGYIVIAAFVLVTLASIVRVLGPFVVAAIAQAYYGEMIRVAGILWALGFILFVVAYYPILTQARVDKRPG